MDNQLSESAFINGRITLFVNIKPVNQKGKRDKKENLKSEIQKITNKSNFIITDTCWIAIDYYCRHIDRLKYPGVYDIDNIVKPILDSLVGKAGLIIDDVIVDRIIVNWIDSPYDHHFEINIEYPDLIYFPKSELIFLKSQSGWCFPTTKKIIQYSFNVVKKYFEVWDSIQSENDYYEKLRSLPIQRFIYQNKIKDKGYTIIDINSPDLTNLIHEK